MRIALLAHAGSVHTRRWAAGLAARGHEVIIITSSAFLGNPDDIPTFLMPGRPPLSYFYTIGRVKKILRHFRPDIVHAHYVTGYGLWGFMQKTAPLVVTVWGTDIADALAGRFLVAPIVRRALRAARRITSPSRFLADQTIQFEPSTADRITLIPFGIEIDKSESMPAKKSGSITIIFAKQYHPTYAPDLVIRAFARAKTAYPDMRLVMIGGGPMQDELVQLAASQGVSDSVDIRGWVDMAEAGRIIRSADIMVMPSVKESFGVAAVEASAAGIPVIATNIGGIPEVIEDGGSGILIDPGNETALADAMAKLAGDVDLRSGMGRRGREIARNRFDIEISLDKMEDVYRQVVEN